MISKLVFNWGDDVGAVVCLVALGLFDWRYSLLAFGVGLFYLGWTAKK